MLIQVKKKAQITIPLKIRKAVGIEEGDLLDVEVKGREIILKPHIRKKGIRIKPVDVAVLDEMAGIFSIGGDAVKDTEDLYNE